MVLSAFTHIWNPIGFPIFRADEGAYMRRAMHVLEGLGPHDPASRFDHSQDSTTSYDHPYFGQLFLAGVFKLIGYPANILNLLTFSSPTSTTVSPSSSSSSSLNSIQHSIEMLYLVPRVLMGILAVIDTFLVYKIAERRYNRNVALIASVLFAVMPMTWILRLIVLDSIQLPFLLCSILFAVYYPIKKGNSLKKSIKISDNNNDDVIDKKHVMLILLSGIFLGLAIFTKLTAVTMIPVVCLILYTNNNHKKNKNNLKVLGLWFIPVILIPMVWPIYSISVGQFDEWLNGVIWQGTARHGGKTLSDIIVSFFRIDPVLLVLGIAGLLFPVLVATTAKLKTRDFLFLVLWSSPYLLLIYLVTWAIIFHLIPILPVFCIAAARLVEYVINRIIKGGKIRISKKKKKQQQGHAVTQQKLLLTSSSSPLLPPLPSFAIILVTAIFVIFGLVTTTMFITTNISLPQFEAAAFVGYDIQHNSNSIDNNNGSNDKSGNGDDGNDITIISSPIYSWIFNYVFHKPHVFSHDRDTQPIQTKKVLLIVDGTYRRVLSKIEGEDEKQVTRLQMLFNNTVTIAIFDGDTNRYIAKYNNSYYDPYASMSENRIGGGGIKVKANYYS